MRILCFLRGIGYSLIFLNLVDGHEYEEIYNNEEIQVLKCKTCGHLSVGFID